MSKVKKIKEVSVASLAEPIALSLVGKPANQVGFRVVRNDKGEEVSVPVRRVRRVRSEAHSAFLYISFPAGTAREDVDSVAKDFGIEGYEVVEEETRVLLRRADYEEPTAPTIDVNLGGGRKVTMLRTDERPTRAQEAGLQLIAITFDKEVFRSEADVSEYLAQKDIDTAQGRIDNTDTQYVFARSLGEVSGTVGKVELEPGVVVSVRRAEEDDMPQTIAVVVSEAAYGSWGWGQLDFAAALADVEFCNLSHEAIYRLQDVVYNIMFYSQLPVAARKELIYRAAAQFALYLGNLLDGLPAGVVLVNRSIKEKEQQTMTVKADQNQPGTASPAEDKPEYLTRADAQAMIQEAVAAAIAAKPVTEIQERSAPEPAASAPAANQNDSAVLASLEAITRSLATLNETVTAVTKRVDSVESTTHVRSDSDDTAPAVTDEPKKQKRDIFDGLFSQNMK